MQSPVRRIVRRPSRFAGHPFRRSKGLLNGFLKLRVSLVTQDRTGELWYDVGIGRVDPNDAVFGLRAPFATEGENSKRGIAVPME